ncbi:MAG: hypothetical protein HY457_03115 [Parcubacteria group bacterium]|nr:hypothetical protein [Parcubacteria group bacterium]
MLWLAIVFAWLIVGLWIAWGYWDTIPPHLKLLAIIFWPVAAVFIILLSPPRKGEKKTS